MNADQALEDAFARWLEANHIPPMANYLYELRNFMEAIKHRAAGGG